MSFEWFDNWANNHLGFTVTLVSGSDENDLLRNFGAGASLDGTMTWLQAREAPLSSEGPEMELSPRSIELLTWIGRSPDDVRAARRQPIDGYLRFMSTDGWIVAIEASTTRGADQGVLAALSRPRHRAVSYSVTPGICPLQYAEAGGLICGIDTVIPAQRWGSDPELFELLARRLVNDQLGAFTPQVVAELLDRWLGWRMTPELLEGPKRAAPLLI